MDCIFCQIINKKIPAETVWEDAETLAFLDINPVTPGHTLLITKEHFGNFLSAPNKVICQTLKVAQKIAPKILKAIGATDFNLIANNGPTAGQSVGHLHFHLIPRGANLPNPGWPTIKYRPGEMQKIAKKIRNEIG